MKLRWFKIFIVFTLIFTGVAAFKSDQAAASPHSIESSVKNAWNSGTVKRGYKSSSWTSGTRLVYDVYSSKYQSNGWTVATKNFTGTSKKYLIFSGWSVLAGYKRHTSSNHSTHIVLRKTSGSSGVGTTKIYKTIPIGIDATEDLEYNNQGSGVWNECSSSATNKNNTTCNMRYDDVGFTAYIPLDEIFSNSKEAAEWEMYIVKRVDSQIVFSPLIVPFEFSELTYNSGKVDLSSGVNAKSLRMNDYPVIRRSYPRQPASSAPNEYFSNGYYYTNLQMEETKTAVWYGVNYNGVKRWANTVYWTFGGDQAELSYTPPPDTTPPQHISHEFIDERYKNGNDYWVQPGDQAYIRLRQRDPDAGNLFQYLRLLGSGVELKSQHDFRGTSSNNNHFIKNSHGIINSAAREENTSYGRVKWGVKANTHGHSYDIAYYYRDKDQNSVGYNDTGMNLRVDGVAPEFNAGNIYNYRYKNGADFWVRPNDQVNIKMRQYDPHSGNLAQYLRLSGSGVDARSLHVFRYASDYNEHFSKSSHVVINSAAREEHSGAYSKVNWGVVPKTHGHSYAVQYYTKDNAENTRGYNNTGYTLRVDGEAPYNVTEEVTGHRYLNGSTYWIKPGDSVNVRLRGQDPDSGLADTGLSIGGGSSRDYMIHDWHGTSTNMSGSKTNADFDITSVMETYESPGGWAKEATWNVKGINHGGIEGIRHYYRDNVWLRSAGDANGWSSMSKYLGVDGQGPSVITRNNADTINYNSQDWQIDPLVVRMKFNDEHSGYKRSRYTWSKSTSTPSSWSSWSTSSNYTATKAEYGVWYLHIQSEDQVGNISTTYKGPYKYHQPNLTAESLEILDLNNQPVSHITIGETYRAKLTYSNTGDSTIGDHINKLYENGTYRAGTTKGTITPGATRFQSFGFQPRVTGNVTYKAHVNQTRQAVEYNYGDNIASTSIYVNTRPEVTLSYNPSPVYTGDVVEVCAKPTDADGDPLEVTIYKNENSTGFSEVLNKTNMASSDTTCYTTERSKFGTTYEFKAVVHDGYDSSEVSISYGVRQLTLNGEVFHTPSWQSIHQERGHQPNQFYSGEDILVKATITDYPASYVESTLKGRLTSGNMYSRTVTLSKVSNTVYEGVIEGEDFMELFPLRKGIVPIEFEVQYTNGEVRNDTVNIEIIDNVLNAYQLHRLY